MGRGDVPILFRPHLGTVRARRHHGLPGDRHDGCPATSPDARANREARSALDTEMSGEIFRASAKFGPVLRPVGTVARGPRCCGLVRGRGPDTASKIREAGVPESMRLPRRLGTVPRCSGSSRCTGWPGTRSATCSLPSNPCMGCLGATRSSGPVLGPSRGLSGFSSESPASTVVQFYDRLHTVQETSSAVITVDKGRFASLRCWKPHTRRRAEGSCTSRLSVAAGMRIATATVEGGAGEPASLPR